MALRPSQMIPLGKQAPDFELLDVVQNTKVKLSDCQGNKGTLVVFMCNHCPYVVYLLEAFKEWAHRYQEKGIATVAISSNDIVGYPQDGPDEMKALAQKEGFKFPYLYDATQEVALAYEAACTPDFYLFDAALKLFYRGRFDGARPGNDTPITGEDLTAAATALLENTAYPALQYPSMGCNIKWTAENTPDYFFTEP
jgi:peroxiredoxin